jgi:glutathione S-transferase
LAQALSVGDHPLEIMMGEQGYLRQFEKYSKPIMKAILSRGYQLNSDKVAESKHRMDILVDVLNQRLIENHGRYFVGERLGLADIAVCSMLAPLLEIAGTPWEKEHGENLSDEFMQYKTFLTNLPLGQYVLRIYQTERNARVDWRGV